MRSTILFLLTVVFFNAAFADNYYEFKKQSAPYVDLTGDTLVNPITSASVNGYEYMIELSGETYSFFGKNYAINDSTVRILFSTDGHMELDDDSSYLIFDGMFTNLDSIDNTSKVSYKIEGTGNNKIIKVQWKNLKIRMGPAGSYVNLQMWMYKATGVVEVHYGASSANNQSGYSNTSGPNIGMFYSDKNFAVMHEKIWLNGLPGSYLIDSSHNFVFNALHGVPAEGTVYRFIPKIIAADVHENTLDEENIKIYPNPTSTALTITKSTVARSNVVLYLVDIQGRVVQIRNIAAGETRGTFNTSGIPGGSYLIKVRDDHITKTYPVTIIH